jgi:hypothetical protein
MDPGSYYITSFTGTFTDPANSAYDGAITLASIPGSPSNGVPVAVFPQFYWGGGIISGITYGANNYTLTGDNEYYPISSNTSSAPGAAGSVFDSGGGILIYTAGTNANTYANNETTYGVNIWGNPGGSYNFFEESWPGNGVSGGAQAGNANVPESGSLSMLLLCVLGLAGAFFYKGRQSGLFLNS